MISGMLVTAALFYAASFCTATFASSGIKSTLTFIFAAAGALTQTTVLGLRALDAGTFPTGTSYELLEVIVWLFVLMQLAWAGVFKIGLVGIFSMLPAAVLTVLPVFCPLFGTTMASSGRAAANLSSSHAFIAAVSYAFMAAGAVAGVMYIVQSARLKSKSAGGISKILPPLQTLDRAMNTCLGSALFCMIVSAVLGALAAFGATMTSMLALKLFTATLVLLMQAALFLATARASVSGRRLAKFEIALAAVSLILLIPIELRTFI